MPVTKKIVDEYRFAKLANNPQVFVVRADKLADLARRVSRVRAHAQPSPDALAANEDALDVVAFNLQLAVQAAADVAARFGNGFSRAPTTIPRRPGTMPRRAASLSQATTLP